LQQLNVENLTMKIWHTFLGAIAICTLAACGGTSDRWSLSISEASKTLAKPGSSSQTADGFTLIGGDGTPVKTDGSACVGGQYGFATGPCQVAVLSNDGTVRGNVTFDWTYSTKDTSGPGADLFGVIVDGTVIPLSDPGGMLEQSGRKVLTVTSSIGWYLNCTDCTQGEAQAKVAGFTVK
jgi:hypothetical protein